MGDWRSATEADRERMLDAMGPSLSPDYPTERSQLLLCIGRAAREGPHASLLILEIARACVALIEHHGPDDGLGDQQI